MNTDRIIIALEFCLAVDFFINALVQYGNTCVIGVSLFLGIFWATVSMLTFVVRNN